jgi:hypothetical protein
VRVADVWLAYEDVSGQRCYWQGKGTRVWRPGEAGRAGAAQFPSMQAARAAIAASRTQRLRLPRVGYELLPPVVEQLQLQIEGAET